MSKVDKTFYSGLAAAVIILGSFWTAADIAQSRVEREKATRLKELVSRYQSPVERTDSQRLDWLSAHRTEAPWTKHETDPRREIDYAMDHETEMPK